MCSVVFFWTLVVCKRSLSILHDDAFILSLEPVDRIVLGHAVPQTNPSRLNLPASHAVPWPGEDDEKVHAENTR